ncbi:flagellar basal body P-ring formation chaperone FlgA [Labedella gwakjiensis]|uniref:Flagellar basal body P-ring formation chaperone FlgA n=1 Tax=Labedella gwakjiensis TaxID=390269 RepID=A0A2P8GXZ4_9MICO|nr:hypothetical protein [Labedella gwakjiensis]PSL38837.1 flagellar basal body P-ring formation chaperone FlgA [Labedella gwakjiensis]RUQ86694.1 hypothetical protein ELQ93_06900 [Labedella gwakjiensis]
MGVLATRRRPVFRAVDVRLVIGAALVLASIGGVWAVVSSSDRSVAVYAASSTIVAGDTIEVADLSVLHVSLGDAQKLYVETGAVADGAVATRTVFAGELVPEDAIGAPQDVSSAQVVVTVAGQLPAGVAAGREVDVWSSGGSDASDGRDREPPSVLVTGATVSRIVEDEGLVSGSGDVSVELALPEGAVAVVLAATASGDTLALVPVTAAD